jgi:hypothetical protein
VDQEAAAHNVAQGYPPLAEQAHKVATAAVPSTHPTNPTVLVAAVVLAGVAETLWPRPTVETAAQV